MLASGLGTLLFDALAQSHALQFANKHCGKDDRHANANDDDDDDDDGSVLVMIDDDELVEHRECDAWHFDVAMLCLATLINCVELNATHCRQLRQATPTALATLARLLSTLTRRVEHDETIIDDTPDVVVAAADETTTALFDASEATSRRVLQSHLTLLVGCLCREQTARLELMKVSDKNR